MLNIIYKTHSLNGLISYAKSYIIKNIPLYVILKTATYVECKAKDIQVYL